MHSVNIAFDRRRLLGLVAAVAAVAGLGGGVRAAATEDAEASVRRLAEQIVRILSGDGIERADGEARRELGAAIRQEADVDLLARLALGRHWRQLDDEQEERYLELFGDFIMDRFVGYLRAYAGEGLGPAEEILEVTGSRQVDERDMVVTSMVRPPGRQPLDVRWRLRGREKPAVIDVVVEDASLLISLRSEFSSVIERQGLEGLLTELKARADRIRSEGSLRQNSSRT